MSPRTPIHWLLLLPACGIIALIPEPSTPPPAHIDWLFLVGAPIVIAMFLIGFFVSIYKLIREYKLKGPLLMEKWRSILFYLVIYPAFSSVPYKNKISSAQNAFETGQVLFDRLKSVTGCFMEIILFYGFSLMLVYSVAWLVKALTGKKLSPTVFGIVILLLWLPANIGPVLLGVKMIHANKNNQTQPLY